MADAEKAINCAWQELVETPDVTSPEDYPDHALITRDQLADFMSRATPPAAVVEAMERALRRAIDDAVADDLDLWFADAKAALANLEAWRAGK